MFAAGRAVLVLVACLCCLPTAALGSASRHHASHRCGATPKEHILHHAPAEALPFFDEGDVTPEEVKRYRILKRLGSGNQGGVALAVDQREGRLVAIKKVYRPFKDISLTVKTLRELVLLRVVNSDYITKIRHVFLPSNSSNFRNVYFSMDAMDGALGSQEVMGLTAQLPHEQQINIAYQILRGLLDLHRVGVVHADVAMSNVVVDVDCSVKLADLGCAGVVGTKWAYPKQRNSYLKEGKFVCSRAPELRMGHGVRYRENWDVWIAGCAILRALSPNPAPFCEVSWGTSNQPDTSYESLLDTFDLSEQMVSAKFSGQMRKHLHRAQANRTTIGSRAPMDEAHPGIDSGLMRVLKSSMLVLDPKDRKSATELLSDPIFAPLGGVPAVPLPISRRARDDIESLRRLGFGESATIAGLRETIYDEILSNYDHPGTTSTSLWLSGGSSPTASSCLLNRPPFMPKEGGGDDCGPAAPTGLKFYLYDELKSAFLCKSGGELLRVVQEAKSNAQHLGPDLFLWQQLQTHPRRTLDPEEASLFVVPSLLNVAFDVRSSLACGGTRSIVIGKHLRSFAAELEESSYYQRHQGRDHLMVAHGWMIKELFGPDRMRATGFLRDEIGKSMTRMDVQRLKHVFRNFIIGNYVESLTQDRGKMRRSTMPQQRRVVVPYLAPSVRDACEAVQPASRVDGGPSAHPGNNWTVWPIQCDSHRVGVGHADASFEEYRRSKTHTLFFLGSTSREEELVLSPHNTKQTASLKRKHLRPAVVDKIGDTRGPNILVSSTSERVLSSRMLHPPPQRPLCNLTAGSTGPTTGCFSGEVPSDEVNRMMRSSLFALHVRGDDSSSSRPYEAIIAGIPQLILADRLYAEHAPFKCRVPYEKIFLWLSQARFRADPQGCIREAVDHLECSPDKWEALWAAQRAAERDLLWQVPGSKVGANIIEEAMQIVDRDEQLQGTAVT